MREIRRKNKLVLILFIVFGVIISLFLLFYIAGKNINYFHTPSSILYSNTEADLQPEAGISFRLGGMVKKNSISRSADGLDIIFVVYDDNAEIKVAYHGILPDLFKEGQGVVAQGMLSENKIFYATQILAKHNAEYAPHDSIDSENNAIHITNAGTPGMTQ